MDLKLLLVDNLLSLEFFCKTQCCVNTIFSFLYWNMEYHIKHNMFSNIFSYNLLKLHELIKNQLPIPKFGLIDAYREIILANMNKSKEHKFKIKLNYPISN